MNPDTRHSYHSTGSETTEPLAHLSTPAVLLLFHHQQILRTVYIIATPLFIRPSIGKGVSDGNVLNPPSNINHIASVRFLLAFEVISHLVVRQ